MMPTQRVVATGALVGVLVAALLGWSAPTSATSSSSSADPSSESVEEPAANISVRVTSRQRVRLEALPQIVQHGGSVADADAARTAIVARLKPVRVGRPVQLQVQQGTSWDVVATARQDGRGRAQFGAVASTDREPATYRVKLKARGGLAVLKSAPVSTERWQQSTWTDEFAGTELRPVWHHRGREYVHSNRRSGSKGDPRAASVGGGALRLSVIKDPDATTTCRIGGRDAVSGRFAYRLNGHVGTQGEFAFRFGFAAARVKSHRMRGRHGAFWLQPTGGMYPGALGSEIDVVEYFGDHHPQGGLATFTHRCSSSRQPVGMYSSTRATILT